MSVSRTPRENYQSYKAYLSRKERVFICPHCEISILAKTYEDHCTEFHNLNAKRQCVWCFGQVAWGHRQKQHHSAHLLKCAKKFIVLNVQPPPAATPAVSDVFVSPGSSLFTPFDREPFCPAQDFFGCQRDPQPRAYEPVWPLPLSPTRLVYDTDCLNRAASCVLAYLELSDSTYWAHIMVRAVAFQSFLAALDSDEGRTRTLPFSCWCNGGDYAEDRYRQHRHMVVVAPSETHFRNVWKKIKIPNKDRPGPNYRIHDKKPLKNTMHLVNTLQYLCKRESLCEFSGDKKNSPDKLNHYYIFESLPKDFRLPLVLQWEGGLLALLNETFFNLNWGELVKANLTFRHLKWHLPVRDIPGIPMGKRLPLTPDFYPCDHPTDYYVHLLEGRKMYFERGACLREGPFFYDAVAGQLWKLRPHFQRLVNEFKPLVDRNIELEEDLRKMRDETNWFKNKIVELEATLARLNELLHAANAQTNALLQAENARLNAENRLLREQENARLKRENATLREGTTK